MTLQKPDISAFFPVYRDERTVRGVTEKALSVLREVIRRYLPFTTKSAVPRHPFLVRTYLALLLAWRFIESQILTTGRKP